MDGIFNYLFEIIDPESHAIIGYEIGLFFRRMFQSLFCEMHTTLGPIMLDLIFTLGSGSLRETILKTEIREAVSYTTPLCRSQ